MYKKSYKGIDVTKDLYNMHKSNNEIRYKRELEINKRMRSFSHKVAHDGYIITPESYDELYDEKHKLRELMLLQTMYSYKMNDRRYYVYEQQLNNFKKVYAHWKVLTRDTFLTYVMKVPQFLVDNFYEGCKV